MNAIFIDLWERSGFPGKGIDVFNQLMKYYSESERYYHNILHIQNCLNEFGLIKNVLLKPLSIEWAIWFHDVTYDPKSKLNEEKSADLAFDILQKVGGSIDLLKNVHDLIIATKHNSVLKDIESQILADIDLSILGSQPSQYLEYSRNIRKEYGFVPFKEYCGGRIKVLQAFLSRPSIYYTEYFQEKYESASRCNIKNEIENLNSRLKEL